MQKNFASQILRLTIRKQNGMMCIVRIKKRDRKNLAEKKIDLAKKTMEKNMGFLRCPLCAAPFGFDEAFSHSPKCQNGHMYDISKKGYINFFGGFTKITGTYGKKLFAARKAVSKAGLYGGLTEKLCEIAFGMNPKAVVDAGCGCGNLTAGIFEKTGRPATFAVDLSKDGIEAAATDFCAEDLLWIVANLNNLPLSDGRIDLMLNIMSPASYAEFNRVLKPGGVLLKVMPEAGYLKELRRFIYGQNDKNEYSNKDVLNNLAAKMDIADTVGLEYSHMVAAEDIPALFDMTPLTQNLGEREKTKNELQALGDFRVTLAFKIAVCVNKDGV